MNRSGTVYQKDLGRKTGEVAAAYTAYDPDHTWSLSPIQRALKDS